MRYSREIIVSALGAAVGVVVAVGVASDVCRSDRVDGWRLTDGPTIIPEGPFDRQCQGKSFFFQQIKARGSQAKHVTCYAIMSSYDHSIENGGASLSFSLGVYQ